MNGYSIQQTFSWEIFTHILLKCQVCTCYFLISEIKLKSLRGKDVDNNEIKF